MSTLIHETPPELMWGPDGNRIELPDGAVAFKVRKCTGRGRPAAYWGPHGIVHLDLDATMQDLRQAVDNEPGSYRLYPVDRSGNELEPVAVIELVELPDESSALAVLGDREVAEMDDEAQEEPAVAPSVPTEVSLRFFDLYERMLSSRDAHDELMAKMLTTLVSTTAGIQQSTAGVLDSATATIKVANGVESLERAAAPELGLEAVTDKLAAVGQIKDTLTSLGLGDTPTTPWFVQLLNGPVGMGLMSFANNFAQAAAAAQKAAAQKADNTEGEED